jgi:hypothetical protein
MTKINLMIELCIKFFSEQNFKGFIKSLLTLRSEVIKLNPENIDVGLVDLIMDEEMGSWAISAMDRSPTDYDWEAARLISLELQDILIEVNKNEH